LTTKNFQSKLLKRLQSPRYDVFRSGKVMIISQSITLRGVQTRFRSNFRGRVFDRFRNQPRPCLGEEIMLMEIKIFSNEQVKSFYHIDL